MMQMGSPPGISMLFSLLTMSMVRYMTLALLKSKLFIYLEMCVNPLSII